MWVAQRDRASLWQKMRLEPSYAVIFHCIRNNRCGKSVMFGELEKRVRHAPYSKWPPHVT